MIEHVYRRAAAASRVHAVLVATDDERIASAVESFGGAALLTSPAHVSGTDRIAEVVSQLPCRCVVNVQGDEPLIDPALIAATARLVDGSTPMATAAHPIHEAADVFNPNVVKVALDKAGRALYFSRAVIPWHRDAFAASAHAAQPLRELPAAYAPLRHIGLYAYRNDFLQTYPELEISPLEQIEALEQLRVLWHGFSIAVHLVTNSPAAGVDTPEDLARVRRHFGA